MKITHLLLFSLMIFVSCSRTDNTIINQEKALSAELIKDVSGIKNLISDKNGNFYYVAKGDISCDFVKINSQNNFSYIKSLSSYFINYPNITVDANNNLYWLTGNQPPKIYSQNNSYELKPDNPVLYFFNVYYFTYLKDSSFAYFDEEAKKVKIYNMINNTQSTIAGSGSYQIKDGIGTNSSFVDIRQMIQKDGIVYFIDNAHYIRKLEPIGNDYKVTTLYYNPNYYFDNITIDKDGLLYLTVSRTGIFTLNQAGFLKSIKTDTDVFKTALGGRYVMNWTNYLYLNINNNNEMLIYVPSDHKLIKIKNASNLQ